MGTGRYRTVAGNLRIKEVRPRAGDSLLTDRFVMMRRALNRIEAQSGAPWSVATT